MNKNVRKYSFSSDHQFVMLDSEYLDSVNALTKNPKPLIFTISYNGRAEDPPSVVFLINPQSMSFSLTKKINPVFTRGGFVPEEWGEMQDTINCSGKIGGYYVKKGNLGSGLIRFDRSKSSSFQNLLSILMLYRNNGAVFQDTAIYKSPLKPPSKLIKNLTGSLSNAGVKAMVKTPINRIDVMGDVRMHYDGFVYLGAFSTLSIEESSSSPFNMSYSFEYVVQKRTASLTANIAAFISALIQ